jgi:5-methylcytosine-specific restriction endonuclease McrA
MLAEAASWRTFVTCVDISELACRVATCRSPLSARRTAYCSDAHAREFARNHVWSDARRTARRRARWQCQRCGFKPGEVWKDPEARKAYSRHELRLEVNHILPLRGSYRGVTCANHLTNLEVLCHRCHVAATAEQRRVIAANQAGSID